MYRYAIILCAYKMSLSDSSLLLGIHALCKYIPKNYSFEVTLLLVYEWKCISSLVTMKRIIWLFAEFIILPPGPP